MCNVRNVAVGVFAALLVGSSLVVAEPGVAPSPPLVTPDRVQLTKRLESVKTLLETSSAAKQIEASGDPATLAERKRALDTWGQAKAALDAGNLAEAQRLLQEAPKILFSAARHAAPEQITGEKLRADFVSRRESVSALMVAQKRISDEKGNVEGAGQTMKTVNDLLVEADTLAAAGNYKDAKVLADKAYLLAKASVGQMRSGDTLVRSLNFANKAEEYKYELDRNDSLAMLYKVLIEQKGNATPTIVEQVKKSGETRQNAERAAAGGDHEAGVKLLEDATSQLIRAIRSAGIFIPG